MKFVFAGVTRYVVPGSNSDWLHLPSVAVTAEAGTAPLPHAAAKVIEAVHVGDTTFECVIQKNVDHLSDCVWLCAIFSLNGMKRTAEVSFHPRDFNGEIYATLKLRDEIAKVIAGEMISSAVSKYKG